MNEAITPRNIADKVLGPDGDAEIKQLADRHSLGMAIATAMLSHLLSQLSETMTTVMNTPTEVLGDEVSEWFLRAAKGAIEHAVLPDLAEKYAELAAKLEV